MSGLFTTLSHNKQIYQVQVKFTSVNQITFILYITSHVITVDIAGDLLNDCYHFYDESNQKYIKFDYKFLEEPTGNRCSGESKRYYICICL